ncbi:MAG: MFS transporter [Thermoleophilaceae bacterium]
MGPLALRAGARRDGRPGEGTPRASTRNPGRTATAVRFGDGRLRVDRSSTSVRQGFAARPAPRRGGAGDHADRDGRRDDDDPDLLRDHDHGLAATGMVISVHIAAMFLPSPITGILVDRFGRRPVIAVGGVTLLAAGLLGAVVPADSTPLLAVSLGLLGLGWNFGLVAGTALVTDATPLARRASTQGSVDLAVALAGATGGISSGFVVATTSYPALSLAGGALALAMLPLLLATREPGPPARPGAPVPAGGPGTRH